MTGIYKITNKINNKSYIGQSVDIASRWYQYYKPSKEAKEHSVIVKAIVKYGIENFIFDVIEECSVADLNDKEMYWVKYYGTYENGYNQTPGGDHNIGESNPNAKLTEQDVVFIRNLYNSKTVIKKHSLYEEYFQDKIAFRGFEKIWSGETWKHIMPEVYTDENQHFYSTRAKANLGESNGYSKATDERVMMMRQRYQFETGRQIYQDNQDIFDSYSGFEKALLGITYSHLPIYKKKLKQWIIL